MNRITSIKVIEEFSSKDSGIIYGTYYVTFNGEQKVFIRNNNSVGAVTYYLGELPMKCVSQIRDDVEQEFLDALKNKNIDKRYD